MFRRKYLSSSAVVLAGASAGCTGSSGDTAESEDTDESDDINESEDTTDDNTEDAADSEAVIDIVGADVSVERVSQPGAILTAIITANNEGNAYGKIKTTIDVINSGGDVSGESKSVTIEVAEGETADEIVDIPVSGTGTIYAQVGDYESPPVLVEPAELAPQVQEASLLNDWNEFGDVVNESTNTTAAGEVGLIGVRYRYWHGNSDTLDVSFKAQVSDSVGQQVTEAEYNVDRLVETGVWEVWEHAIRVDFADVDPGEYEAVIQLRNDRRPDATSDLTRISFEVM